MWYHVLTNAEIWYNITKEELKELEDLETQGQFSPIVIENNRYYLIQELSEYLGRHKKLKSEYLEKLAEQAQELNLGYWWAEIWQYPDNECLRNPYQLRIAPNSSRTEKAALTFYFPNKSITVHS